MNCPKCDKSGFVTDLPVSILLCKEHGYWTVLPIQQVFVDQLNEAIEKELR
jgi:hypothetical protein